MFNSGVLLVLREAIDGMTHALHRRCFEHLLTAAAAADEWGSVLLDSTNERDDLWCSIQLLLIINEVSMVLIRTRNRNGGVMIVVQIIYHGIVGIFFEKNWSLAHKQGLM